MNIINIYTNQFRGFIAVTAVIMVACASLFFSSLVLRTVIDYSDSVTHLAWRTQANQNAENCLNIVTLMSEKDYFLSGEVYVQKFACNANVTRNRIQKTVIVKSKTIFNGVSSGEHEQLFTLPIHQ